MFSKFRSEYEQLAPTSINSCNNDSGNSNANIVSRPSLLSPDHPGAQSLASYGPDAIWNENGLITRRGPLPDNNPWTPTRDDELREGNIRWQSLRGSEEVPFSVRGAAFLNDNWSWRCSRNLMLDGARFPVGDGQNYVFVDYNHTLARGGKYRIRVGVFASYGHITYDVLRDNPDSWLFECDWINYPGQLGREGYGRTSRDPTYLTLIAKELDGNRIVGAWIGRPEWQKSVGQWFHCGYDFCFWVEDND